jgi:hypothetical protein
VSQLESQLDGVEDTKSELEVKSGLRPRLDIQLASQLDPPTPQLRLIRFSGLYHTFLMLRVSTLPQLLRKGRLGGSQTTSQLGYQLGSRWGQVGGKLRSEVGPEFLILKTLMPSVSNAHRASPEYLCIGKTGRSRERLCQASEGKVILSEL